MHYLTCITNVHYLVNYAWGQKGLQLHQCATSLFSLVIRGLGGKIIKISPSKSIGLIFFDFQKAPRQTRTHVPVVYMGRAYEAKLGHNVEITLEIRLEILLYTNNTNSNVIKDFTIPLYQED